MDYREGLVIGFGIGFGLCLVLWMTGVLRVIS